MVCDQIFYLCVQRAEDIEVGGDEGTLRAVASREVLRGDDGNDLSLEAAHEQDLAVVVGKIGGIDDLGDERPELEGLVGGLVVEHQVEAGDEARLLDEEQPSDEFFGDREGCLPHLGLAELLQRPFHNVGHLQGVGEISLVRFISQRLQKIRYVGGAFHKKVLPLQSLQK